MIINATREHRQELQAQLDQWIAQLDELEAKTDRAEPHARLRYLQTIYDLRDLQRIAQQKMYELRFARSGGGRDLEADVERALEVLGDATQSRTCGFRQTSPN